MPLKMIDGKFGWKETSKEDIEKTKDELSDYASNTKTYTPEVATPTPGKLVPVDRKTDVLQFAGANANIMASIEQLLIKGITTADIIIPIYGSLHIAKHCINTVLTRTKWPFHLTIVDDGSDKYTVDWLKRQDWPENVTVLFNKKNRGFSATVNRGIRNTKNPYLCILNSDVLVTKLWLTKMIIALESSSKNVIVNPVTNNTALINVEMQEGCDYLAMNQAFEMTSKHKYPEVMPTGFCFLFHRSLTNVIGLFDEGYQNYGEESDFWMKSITYLKDGYYLKHKAVLADDTYLFHERGASFSALHSDKHMDFRKTASARFHRTWPQYTTWIKANPAGKILAPYREKLPRKAVTKMGAEYRICWVVRSTAMCGGMKYISDVVNEINERGGDARVALVLRDSNNPGEILPELRTRPIIFSSEEEFLNDFPKRVFKKGIVVSAISELASLVHKLCDLNTELTGVNHVQSYDPMIAQDDDLKKKARDAYPKLSYTITNSQWITDILKKEYSIKALGTVHPGVDRSLYYPRGRERGDERPTVLIALNRKYHYRGFNRGALLARYLDQISKKKNSEIRIMAVGVEAMPEAPNVIGLGDLAPTRLAHVLGTEVDIFIDPSDYHSYGLPGLEAMASGVPFLCWDNIGVNEYGENGKDCVILPKDTPPDEAAIEVYKLLAKVEIRKTFAYAGLDKVKLHDRADSVDKFITILEKELSLSYPKRKIVFVTPHLRKHGGPTTIIQAANEMFKRGHDVSLTCVIPDLNPEVTVQSRAPINLDFKNIPECDVLIVPSDNHDSDYFNSLPQAKHKINFKMGHNERFKENEENSLKLKWDRIITTTEWLADVCRKPTKEWDYPPTENVERVGWFHYSHGKFNCPPGERTYGGKNSSFIITTLIHHHPLKGTMEALAVLDRLRRKYKLEVVGVGEVNPKQLQLPPWVRYMYQPNRDRMVEIFKQTDIWVGASFTEGLGRISLEAMSAGVACVISDTDPEFATHRENCILYPIGDKDAMEKAIESLLDDDSLFQKIREKGYNTAKRYSSPVHFVEALEKIVYRVCEK